MKNNKQDLIVLSERFAICRLDPDDSVPNRALTSSLFSVTRTPEELSVVCNEKLMPEETSCEKGWRCLKVQGPIDFSKTGILSSLAQPLARENVSIFALSTYDTDYVLVKEKDLSKAIETLTVEGFTIRRHS